MSRADDAKQLLENPIFRDAILATREDYVQQIESNDMQFAPESAMALRVLKDVMSHIENNLYDEKVAEFNQARI